MKTSYGLEFQTTTDINPNWSDYDELVARNHLKNFGVIIIDIEYGVPIDNEYDLDEIYPMIKKCKKQKKRKNGE